MEATDEPCKRPSSPVMSRSESARAASFVVPRSTCAAFLGLRTLRRTRLGIVLVTWPFTRSWRSRGAKPTGLAVPRSFYQTPSPLAIFPTPSPPFPTPPHPTPLRPTRPQDTKVRGGTWCERKARVHKTWPNCCYLSPLSEVMKDYVMGTSVPLLQLELPSLAAKILPSVYPR